MVDMRSRPRQCSRLRLRVLVCVLDPCVKQKLKRSTTLSFGWAPVLHYAESITHSKFENINRSREHKSRTQLLHSMVDHKSSKIGVCLQSRTQIEDAYQPLNAFPLISSWLASPRVTSSLGSAHNEQRRRWPNRPRP